MRKLFLIVALMSFVAVSNSLAQARWYSQEQIMNAVFDPVSQSLIIKSTNSTAVATVKIYRYEGQVSTGTAGTMTSPGTIFNALGNVLYVDYYVKGGLGADTEISNSKMGGSLKIPAKSSKDTPFFANPLIAPVIKLVSLTPGATFHFEIVFQQPE